MWPFSGLNLVPLDNVPRLCLAPRPCCGCGLLSSAGEGAPRVAGCVFLPPQVSGRQRSLLLGRQPQPQEHICIILWQQANFLEGVFGRAGSRPEGKLKETGEQEARRKQAWAEAESEAKTRPWPEVGLRGYLGP